MEELRLTKDEFVEWFDNINNDVVKHYKFDKYYDIKMIMDSRDEVIKCHGESGAQVTMYWSVRETGTTLNKNLGGFVEANRVLGAKVSFKLDFDFDDSNDNPFCVVMEIDSN